MTLRTYWHCLFWYCTLAFWPVFLFVPPPSWVYFAATWVMNLGWVAGATWWLIRRLRGRHGEQLGEWDKRRNRWGRR